MRLPRMYDAVKEHLCSIYLSSPSVSVSAALTQTAEDETKSHSFPNLLVAVTCFLKKQQ